MSDNELKDVEYTHADVNSYIEYAFDCIKSEKFFDVQHSETIFFKEQMDLIKDDGKLL